MEEFEDDDDDLLTSICLEDPEPVDEQKEDTSVPESFPFPFEAYDIQTGFMTELYKCLNNGKIGIFESPTGTGKSLSLICGALKWLKDFREKQQQELEELTASDSKGNSQVSNGELDWIADFAKKKEKEEKLKKVKEEQENILKREAKLKELGRGVGTHQVKRKRVKMEDEFEDLMKDASVDMKEAFDAEMEELKKECNMSDVQEDAHLMLEDYLSDDDTEGGKLKEDELVEEHITKIYFCSRTHSQLSQFVREVIKSPYGDDTRVISLGSRQNLCVNEAVKKLKSLSLINETCLDMQKKGKKSTSQDGPSKKRSRLTTCPYHKYDVLQDFKDALLLEVRDIEQLVTVGKQMKACPYYGTRYAIPAAEIVALPYNTLLHKSTREACGIKLKDNIVIIDEAHNLLETINNIYSVEITGNQALRAHNQLSQYEKKYRSRLKAKNLMYVKQILFVLSAIVKCLGGKIDESSEKQVLNKTETQLKTINDFLFITQLDNLNLFKVLRYCERSQISRKLHGFVEKYADTEIVIEDKKEKETSRSGVTKFLQELNSKNTTSDLPLQEKSAVLPVRDYNDMSSPLMHIECFLQALTNADKDGRIVISKQGLLSQSSIKFLLLNPAVHFTSVVQEARSVIVAGGTMQPISEFTDQLFHSAGVSPSRVMTYSCGHVVPGDHILPLTVATGPSGYEMDFTFQSRESPGLIWLREGPVFEKESSKCSCAIGMSGLCGHISGLLYTLAHMKMNNITSIPCDIVKTSLPQTWHIPRGEKIGSSRTDNLHLHGYNLQNPKQPTKGLQSTLYNPLVSSNPLVPVADFCTRLDEIDKECLMLSVVEKYPAGPGSEIVDTRFGKFFKGSPIGIQQKLSKDYMLNLLDVGDFIPLPARNVMLDNFSTVLTNQQTSAFSSIKINMDECHHIEEMTRLQSLDPKWHAVRRDRITASVAGDIAKRRADYEPLVTRLKSTRKIVTENMKYGLASEPIAVNAYVQLDELGRILVNIGNIIPGGIVCFFPSYDYESLVFNHWHKTGLIDRLSKKKKVLREPRKSGVVENILCQYSTVIKRCKSFGTTQPQTGAILMCVVGGKMSEGINFSDDLGRCVVMVGLPYPNLKSPELKEKMDYLNANYPRDTEGRQPGQIHYENLCMKAVNQSIGRAIRHRGDYATILLVDRRYNRNNVISKLPNWISQHLQKPQKFGLALGAISKFFAQKKEHPP